MCVCFFLFIFFFSFTRIHFVWVRRTQDSSSTMTLKKQKKLVMSPILVLYVAPSHATDSNDTRALCNVYEGKKKCKFTKDAGSYCVLIEHHDITILKMVKDQ